VGFKEVFPTELSPSIPADELPVIRQRLELGNTAITISDLFQPELEILKAKLDSRGITLGDIIGIGDMGGITYNLLDKNGAAIKSAVLRIDPADLVTILERPSPASIRPILREREDFFAATIVPRAERVEFTADQIMHSLAIINADDQLRYIKDLESKQFMRIPGIPVPVITDLGCMSTDPDTLKGMGSIDDFLEILGRDRASLDAIKVAPEEMAQLRQAQNAIHDNAVAELTAAGINLESVPTKQEGVTLTPVAQPQITLAR